MGTLLPSLASNSLAASLIPTLSSTVAIATALGSLSCTHNDFRFTTFILIAVFTLLAFYHSNDFTRDAWINFIFARYQLIFLAYQGFAHCVISQEDLLEERRRWQSRSQIDRADANARSTDSKTGKKLELVNSGDQGANQSDREQAHLGPDWLFGYKMLFNGMCLGTKWEVRRSGAVNNRMDATENAKAGSKHAIDRSSGHGSGPKTALTSTFVIRRLSSLLARYIALCIIYDPLFYFRMPYGAPIVADDYSPANRSFTGLLIRQILETGASTNDTSSKDTAIVILHALVLRFHHILHLFTTEYLILSSYHDILSILFVGVLRLDSPAEWPSLYGNILQAYTIRRFWSEYWHLLIYRSFSGFAGLALNRIGLSRRLGRIGLTRLLHNGLVFVASGLMHVMVHGYRLKARAASADVGAFFGGLSCKL